MRRPEHPLTGVVSVSSGAICDDRLMTQKLGNSNFPGRFRGAIIGPAMFALAVLCGAGAAMLVPAPQVMADDDDDHEMARRALEQREILPLGQVLAQIERDFQGDVVEIELERKKGYWIYDIEIIDTDGRVREIEIDAKSGEVLKVEYD